MLTPFAVHFKSIVGARTSYLSVRPICCTVHQPQQNARRIDWPRGSDDEGDIHCELCICDLELDYLVKFLPHTTVWE